MRLLLPTPPGGARPGTSSLRDGPGALLACAAKLDGLLDAAAVAAVVGGHGAIVVAVMEVASVGGYGALARVVADHGRSSTVPRHMGLVRVAERVRAVVTGPDGETEGGRSCRADPETGGGFGRSKSR